MTEVGVALGVAVLGASLLAARRERSLWLLDPRGLVAVAVFLNACALPIYRLVFNEYPAVFGLDEARVGEATALLVSGQLGLLIGTLMPSRAVAGSLPAFQSGIGNPRIFLGVLAVSVIATGAFQYVRIVAGGLDRLLAARYGANQWDNAADVPALLNIGYLCVPTLLLLLVAWAIAGRSLRSPLLWALVLYAILPSIIGGSRRDLVFCVVAAMLSYALRGGRAKVSQLVMLIIVVVSLLYGLGLSRSGTSLSVADRVAAIRQNASAREYSLAANTTTTVSGTALMTATLNMFPAIEGYAGGSTYLGAVANVFAPKALTGGYAFIPAGLHFRELFYADVEGYGMDYSWAAEGYQNFGVAGPLLVFIALGWLLEISFSKAMRGSAVWLLLHAHLTTAALWALRTDSNTSFKLATFGCVWLLALRAFSRLLAPRWTPERPRHQEWAPRRRFAQQESPRNTAAARSRWSRAER